MLREYGSKDSSQSKIETDEISDLRRMSPQVCVAGVGNLILLGWGLLLGYPSTLINGLQSAKHNNNNNNNATQNLEKNFELTTEEISWIASINLLSITFGCVSSGLLMDSIGKRRLMQILNVSMLVAWALFYFASDRSQIYIGLCLSGVSGGLLEPSILIYIAETVQLCYQDILIATAVASVLIGALLQFIIRTYIIYWRSVALISAIIPILGFIAVFFVPETPYWLCKKKRIEEAHKSLQNLRGSTSFENVKKEFEQIKSSIEDCESENETQASPHKMLNNCLIFYTKRNFIAPFFLVVFIFACGDFSGIFSLQIHAKQIFDFYHISIDEYHGILLVRTAQVLGCIIGLIFIKFIGKRRLLFFSMISCSLCYGAVATHYQCYSHDGHMESSLNSTTNQLQSSFEHFEYSFLRAAIAFRDRVDEEAIQMYGIKVVDINETKADKLKQIIEIITIANRFTFDNFTQETSNTKHLLAGDNFLDRYFNSLMAKPKVLDIFTVSEMINKTFANWNNYKEYNSNDLFAIINITKAVVRTSISNEIEKQTIFAIIENIIDDTQILNTFNYNNSKLIDNLNDLTWMLSLFGDSLTTASIQLPILARDKIAHNQNWLILILLLGGSLFSHAGTKLLPWMLIVEIYPMKIRTTAAGISIAIGYLIGLISSELFMGMLFILTMNGIFWCYSAVTALGCIILYFILPETENRRSKCNDKPKKNTWHAITY